MGIDYHGARWLKYAFADSKIENLLTLGRQSIHLSGDEFLRLSGRKILGADVFAESFLQDITSAASIQSLDYSDYENASIVSDLNYPVPDELHDRYDAVVDGGTIEHVFNVSEALANCVRLCKQGGTIVHILPADNFNGHGFWQFSAEVFFALYSAENGFSDTEMVFVPMNQKNHWYKVKQPQTGRRVHIASKHPTHIMVKTKKNFSGYGKSKVLQSDYVAQWQDDKSDEGKSSRLNASEFGPIHSALSKLYNYPFARPLYDWLRRQSHGFNIFNRDLEKIEL